jgi:tetratricopeptide (TPR) repeat protein
MTLDQYDKAALEFKRVVDLNPAFAPGQLNLSLALSLLRRYPEAEAAARRAVQLDPKSARASYALGQILTAQGKDSLEALKNLRMALDEFPIARLQVAMILVRQGAIPDAVAELREYLKTGKAEKRQLVESWLAHLTATPPN